MRKNPIYRTWGILIVIILTWPTVRVVGQDVQGELLKCELLRDSLLVDESSFSFNNISFKNTGGARIDADIIFTAPDFIDIITGREIKTAIEAGQNKIVPFRFAFAKRSVPVAWYPVLVETRLRQTGQVIRRIFYLRPKENNNWKASLKQSSITFRSTDTDVPFELLVQNTGNSRDTYKISFDTDLNLDQSKKNLVVDLDPGENRFVTVRIILNPKEIQSMVKQYIDITIRNGKGESKLMRQSIALIGHVYTGLAERWNKMPLTFELNLQNLASGQPYAYMNALGFMRVNERSRLSVQYQSNHYYYDGLVVDNRIARVEYERDKMKIGLGSVTDFNNFLIDGVGGKLTLTGKNQSVYQLTAARGRTGDNQYYNARVLNPLSEKMTLTSNVVAYLDRSTHVNSYLALNSVDWMIGKTTKLVLEAGAGTEQIMKTKLDTSLRGMQWGYLFDRTGKHFQLRSNVSSYSKNFPGFSKGFQYQLHEARWFTKQVFAGLYLEKNYRSFNQPTDSAVNFLFNIRTTEYGVRGGLRTKKGSIAISPGILTQMQDSLSAVQARMHKLGINANFQIREKISLSLYSNIGHVTLDRYPPGIKPFNSFNNLFTLQANQYGMDMRYDNGPYYYYEIKQFITEPSRFRRFQVAPFIELPVPRWNFSYRLQLNYISELPNSTDLYLVYNNLQYSSLKKGLDFGLTGQWDVKGRQDPFVNLVIRKKIKMPVLLNKNSVSLNIKLFLDKNANGKFDGTDEPVENAQVVASEALVMTNSEGVITFRNIERKPIQLDLSHISHLKGWIPKAGYNQWVAPGSETMYYIPFSKSKVATGKLFLLRDDKSSLTMDLEAIRMIAVSGTGEVFNALTNKAGEYFFNLPAGDYTISINQAVFDENFRPVELTKLVDLMNNDEAHLQFEIRQKKRQLNIRKQ